MRFQSAAVALVASVLLVGAVNAATYTTDAAAAGTYDRDSSFIVTTDVSFDCTEEGPSAGDHLVTIANAGDIAWLNASETTVSYDPSGCLTGLGTVTVEGVEINVTIGADAPAFEEVTLQPGVAGGSNSGGDFAIDVAYAPDFTAPTALSFDAVAGGATATIPLTSSANADSVFNFDVASFTIDGAEAPESATAHITETTEVATAVGTDNGTVSTTMDLHFGDGQGSDDHHAMEGEDGAMESEENDDMAMEDETMDTAHSHWETAEVIVSVTLAAKDDDTLVSEAQEIVITFTNTDEETMPHEDEHDEGGDDEGFFKSIPGFELVAAIAALGAIAALRRRD